MFFFGADILGVPVSIGPDVIYPNKMEEQLLIAKYRADSLHSEYVPVVNAEHMQLYPNPATGSIHVILPYTNGIIEVRDLYGRRVLLQNITALQTNISLEGLAPGMYNVIWHNDEKKLVSKFVIK